MSFTRFAIYYLPPEGALATFGARWLGWDVAAGQPAPRLGMPDNDDITGAPRKYGFHATLKPPFRLAEGTDADGLRAAVARMAAGCAPAVGAGLELSRLGRFLALTPVGDAQGLVRVAETCVRQIDAFRAPPDGAELARRRQARLSPRQDALLMRWGYPHVMDEFRFHMTLTGRLAPDTVGPWQVRIADLLPPLPAPFALDQIALVGERPTGRFELIHRYALTG